MPILRNAAPNDADRLAELAERTFRDAFAAQNTPEDMDLHCALNYSAEIQAREIDDPGVATILCEDDGRLVGYVQLGWRPAPVALGAERTAELQRLYVDRRWHGTGVAQALMAEALGRAKLGRADRIWLGVWERNPRAIAFYEKWGFAVVGEHRFLLGNDPQRDLVMARSIESGAGEPGKGAR